MLNKQKAENKVALALSAAEDAAAQAEIATGRLEKAMREYQTSMEMSSMDSRSSVDMDAE